MVKCSFLKYLAKPRICQSQMTQYISFSLWIISCFVQGNSRENNTKSKRSKHNPNNKKDAYGRGIGHNKKSSDGLSGLFVKPQRP